MRNPFKKKRIKAWEPAPKGKIHPVRAQELRDLKASVKSPHSKKTTLTELATGNIKIFHSQGLKQSINYQTSEAVYGLEVEVEPKNADEAVRLMESAIQKLLLPKAQKQFDYLSRLNGH